MYPAECGEQLGRALSKLGSSKFLVLKSFSGEGTLWDSSLPVSLTLWDTPALFTPPLPLPQCFGVKSVIFLCAMVKHSSLKKRRHVQATLTSEAPLERVPTKGYERGHKNIPGKRFMQVVRARRLVFLKSGESNQHLTLIFLKSIAMHLPFLSQYFCKSMPSFWQKAVYTPPICITIRLPFVSRYFCRSIRVRGVVGRPPNLIKHSSENLS